jgi:glutamate carboxypeptidase
VLDFNSYYQEHISEIVDLTTTLANFESPTGSKSHVDAVGVFIEKELIATGAQVERTVRTDAGDLLLAKWNADKPGLPILFVLHMDTVWPLGTLAARPVHIEGDKLIGPGTYDMKSSIALILTVVRTLRAHNQFPDRPIWAFINSDEETGSVNSQTVIEQTAKQSGLALVMEFAAKNEGLKTWRKGVGHYTLRIGGRSSHAGNAPEKGINAVLEAAHQTLRISALAAMDVGTSVSVTVLNGGSAVNVIPDSASLRIDVRFSTRAEADRVMAGLQSLAPVVTGATLALTVDSFRGPMEHDETMVRTFAEAKKIAAAHGIDLSEDGSGGGSDGNFTAALGIPTLDGLGAHGDGAHALHEHCLIPSLARRAALISALICEWPPMSA